MRVVRQPNCNGQIQCSHGLCAHIVGGPGSVVFPRCAELPLLRRRRGFTSEAEGSSTCASCLM